MLKKFVLVAMNTSLAWTDRLEDVMLVAKAITYWYLVLGAEQIYIVSLVS